MHKSRSLRAKEMFPGGCVGPSSLEAAKSYCTKYHIMHHKRSGDHSQNQSNAATTSRFDETTSPICLPRRTDIPEVQR